MLVRELDRQRDSMTNQPFEPCSPAPMAVPVWRQPVATPSWMVRRIRLATPFGRYLIYDRGIVDRDGRPHGSITEAATMTRPAAGALF